MQLDQHRLDQQERLETAKIGAKIAENNTQEELERARIASQDQISGAKLGVEIAKEVMGR